MRLAVVLLGLMQVTGPTEGSQAGVEPRVPAQEDWIDFGWIVDAGVEGDWDHYLEGMLTASAAKKGESFFLYYGGACCYNQALDSVTFRAIGVATSPDGIRFTKHPHNPVISWLPNNGREEGATSSAVVLDSANQIHLYYGANTQETRTTVNADARLGISSDGSRFNDQGIVLDHRDRSIWGSGDEIFPITALRHGNTWIVFYLTNGVPQQRHLGVAWGNRGDRLTRSAPARANGKLIPVWGVGGGASLMTSDLYALFLNDLRIPQSEVRTFSADSPDVLSTPVQTYRWENVKQITVLLDQQVRTWFLYYRDLEQRHYGVKLAPFSEQDRTPPSSPTALHATQDASTVLRLRWAGATDPDTGIAQYRVYRDGIEIASTVQETFVDAKLHPGAKVAYAVSAVNFHGIEGPRSPRISVELRQP
jgi:hypothetical protein